MAETSYVKCGDLSLAYQVFGDGPVELVYVAGFVSHIELVWTVPEHKAFFVRTLDDRAAEIEAVMDAAGFGQAAAMRRSDRAVEMVATRAPWILRGMAHLVDR